ncbi:histidine kinase dimerization/phosphoacceptor domain -containing protein [Marispirochaeta sp.]|uniref:histidine kinase dimerization/phosphoacceptor domain -containing protein n=1 Tax=Marispirochaeta sp. TaxID=2038653 RepID=UPI0029C7E699|nr:histidine kinase dimerization/phosphoacceptor domain -containing protein [Marispirochaeta sp.]
MCCFEQQKETLALSIYVLYGAAILLNAGMSFLIGMLKDAYLHNKKALLEVEQSKAKYQKVVDNIKEGMIIVDTSGFVIFMNRSASVMLNLPVTDLGFSFLDIFTTSIPFDENSGVDETGLGSVSEYIIEYDHPELGIRQIAVSETPYMSREGNLSGSLKFLLDITDTREKNVTIEILRKRNEYLFAEMHDRIGNNLNAINSYINLYLRNNDISKSEGLDKLDDIIHTMALLNSQYFMNFKQQTVNLAACMTKIVHDLSEKYYYSTVNIQLDLIRKNVHIDTAVPFGMLFTIIIATILMLHRDEENKPMISIDMEMVNGKSNVQITVEKSGFFIHQENSESGKTEKEIVSALLLQINGKVSIVPGAGNTVKIVF